MPKIANPTYVPTAGVCMNGFYPGYTGPSGTGSMHNAMVALETFLDTNIEAISLGMPNDMGDVTSFVNSIQGCPQHVIGTLPLGNLNQDPANGEVGSLTRVVAGDYDARIDAMAAKLIAAGWNGDRMTIRLGWEWDGGWTWGLGSYIDPSTGARNTPAMYKAAWRHVVARFRAAGWTGRFDWNGPARSSDPTTFDAVYPGNDFGGGCQVVGYDFYDGISNAAFYSTDDPTDKDASGNQRFNAVGSATWPAKYRYGYKKSEYATVFKNEAKARLDSVAAFARSHGLLMGIAECGHITGHTNRYHSNDNPDYWPLLAAWIKANCDVCAYVCPFNQNIVGSEDDAMFVWNGYKGTVPTASWTGDTIVATAAGVTGGGTSPVGMAVGTAPPSLGSVDNGNRNATGSWSNSPSLNQAINRPTYIANFKAGAFVFTAAPAPVLTEHHRLENFPLSSDKFTALFGAPVPTTPWTFVPGAPTATAVRSADGKSVAVTWAPPSFDGGSPVTGYLVTIDGDAASTSPTLGAAVRSYSFSGLTGAAYDVTVTAINAVGQSLAATVTVAAVGGPATAPANVTALKVDAATATFSWDPVPGATGYRIDVSAGHLTQVGDFYVDTYQDGYAAIAVPTGVNGSPSLHDAYSDLYVDTYGVSSSGTIVTPPVSISLGSVGPRIDVSGLTPATVYIVTVTPLNALAAGPSSRGVTFTTLASGATDSGTPTPPVVLAPPDWQAFPVGASLRPINFGVKVANNG